MFCQRHTGQQLPGPSLLNDLLNEEDGPPAQSSSRGEIAPFLFCHRDPLQHTPRLPPHGCPARPASARAQSHLRCYQAVQRGKLAGPRA
eukprot:1263647-Pyramimonas_sp.AAC.1